MIPPPQILCLPRKTLEDALIRPGFVAWDDPAHPRVAGLLRGSVWHAGTRVIEENPGWIQWVSYGVLTYRGLVFCYDRPARAGEPQFGRFRSFGVGSHVESQDNFSAGAVEADPRILAATIAREVDDEIRPASGFEIVYRGLLYDPADPVGRIHLGAIHTCRFDRDEIDPSRDELAEGTWHTPGWAADATMIPWESWSRILIGELPRILTGPGAPPEPSPAGQ